MWDRALRARVPIDEMRIEDHGRPCRCLGVVSMCLVNGISVLRDLP